MKKQLLIAAVAATMTSVAMADISITGNMKVNYKNTDLNGATTDLVTHETNLVFAGSNGDTSVHMEVALDGADASAGVGTDVTTEDVWLSTKIGDVSVKTGTWNGSDSIFAKDSTRTQGNWVLGTSVAGASVSIEGDSGKSATVATVSGDIAGVSAKYKMKSTSNELYLSGDVSGFGVTFAMIDADATTSDATAFTVSKEFNGVTVSYSDVSTDASYAVSGDTSAFGDAAAIGMIGGDDASSIKLATSIAGNSVSARFVSVDAANDFDVNTFQVTRALAGGTTLEVTYTDTDKTGSNLDKEVLDIELAVKF
jgi:hypothetical protein